MTLSTIEAVLVISTTHVIDVQEHIYSYEMPAGDALVVGSWYVVDCPVTVAGRRLGAGARYRGPFPSELAARLKLEERRAMGLWDAHAARQIKGNVYEF